MDKIGNKMHKIR